MEIYSIHNKVESVIAERFIRTVKDKNYKYMTSVSKNLDIDKLDDIVNKCNNANHSTVKTKLVDVKSSTYIYSIKENNERDIKFKTVDIARKYFAKAYTPNWSEEVFIIETIKKLCRRLMLLVILMEKKLLERFNKNTKKDNSKKSSELKK